VRDRESSGWNAFERAVNSHDGKKRIQLLRVKMKEEIEAAVERLDDLKFSYELLSQMLDEPGDAPDLPPSP
jgi:hypothetical protein